MIEAQHITKRYGEKIAVDDLTFTVKPGIVTGFLGPNGAGKSTAMRLIIGLDAPTRGQVTVNGKAYRDHAAPLHEVGTMLEARAIHTGRSAYNHLLALAQTHGIPGAARRRGDRPRRTAGGRAQARRQLLARDGAAARYRVRAARRSRDADPRRAGQRARSRGHPLDPQPPAQPRRGGADDLRVVAPDERDVADGRPADRRRARQADRGHHRRRLHPPGVERHRARAHAAPGGARAGARRRRRHGHLGDGARAARGEGAAAGSDRRHRCRAWHRAARAHARAGIARGGVHATHARCGRVPRELAAGRERRPRSERRHERRRRNPPRPDAHGTRHPGTRRPLGVDEALEPPLDEVVAPARRRRHDRPRHRLRGRADGPLVADEPARPRDVRSRGHEPRRLAHRPARRGRARRPRDQRRVLDGHDPLDVRSRPAPAARSSGRRPASTAPSSSRSCCRRRSSRSSSRRRS